MQSIDFTTPASATQPARAVDPLLTLAAAAHHMAEGYPRVPSANRWYVFTDIAAEQSPVSDDEIQEARLRRERRLRRMKRKLEILKMRRMERQAAESSLTVVLDLRHWQASRKAKDREAKLRRKRRQSQNARDAKKVAKAKGMAARKDRA